ISLRSRPRVMAGEVAGQGDMTASTRWRLAPQIAGALLALLASGLHAPNSARAACGNHVAPGTPPLGAILDSEAATLLGDLPQALPATPGRRSPCSGSMCSGGPVAPMVPAPPAPVRGESWACLPAPMTPIGPRPTACQTDEALARPSWRSF